MRMGLLTPTSPWGPPIEICPMAAKRARPTKKKAAKKKVPRKKAPAKKRAAKGDRVDSVEDQRVAEIQRLIDVMVRAGAVEVEMEDVRGGKLRVRLKEDPPAIVAAAPIAGVASAPLAAVPEPHDAPAAPRSVEEDGEEFLSPMVGTFYRAPSPEAEPFIHVDDSVGEDTTVCIIEAMKVMNEIKAEMRGRIVSILVEDGEPVEFGQPLFRIQRG